MKSYDIWWVPIQRDYQQLARLGLNDGIAIPVLVEKDGIEKTDGPITLTFMLRDIVLGMLVALGQSDHEANPFDRQRLVSALRLYAEEQDDHTCEALIGAASAYMGGNFGEAAGDLVAYVGHAYFGIDAVHMPALSRH